MAVISVNKMGILDLGRQGENLATTIEIDVSPLLEKYPGAIISLLVKRRGDTDPYFADATVKDGILVWPITSVETSVVGDGKIEIQAIAGKVVAKSVTATIRVGTSLSGSASTELPDYHPSWVDEVLAAAGGAGSGGTTGGGGSGSAENTTDRNLVLYEEAKTLISRFNHQHMANREIDSSKVDIAIFAGQSNSCGRATTEDVATSKDLFLTCPMENGITFNNTATTTPVQIVEPITANGSTAYGYIPAFINAYSQTTGRKVCACFKSYGGAMINKWFPYVPDDATGEETSTVGTFYKAIIDAVAHAKTNLSANGYTVGDVFLVWCQGEADAAYLGNVNSYAYTYEQALTDETEIREYYKAKFSRIVEKLQEDVGLSTAFIIRIGHSQSKPERNTNIIVAQNELCRENPDCVMVSSLFAGALYFVEENGSVRNLMRDASHYVPEGYLRAGMEAGVNAGIYNNSNKTVKPILLEYHTLKTDDATEYERPVDKFIYDPCRIDLNFMSRYATNVATTAIALTATSAKVEIGKGLQLTCGFTPVNATDRDIAYTSSNTSLATVDNNGLVTGIALGDVMITATLVSDSSITATITLEVVEAAEDEGGSGDGGDTTDENVVFDFDFTANNLDDYALSNIFTFPDGSDVSAIEYHSTYGMTLNGQLPNGLNLVEPIDASKPWTLDFTALFVTPTVLAGNRRAFLGGANLYPFVFINGTTYDSMGFQISNGTHATKYGILAYDVEATYKIVHNGSGSVEIFVNEKSKGTVSVDFTGGQFTVILGNVPGKSSAYVWKNVENTNSYLHKLKFTYN